MRWQHVARVVVAAGGLATAVAIYVYSRERPVPTRPPITLSTDPNAILQSGAGRQERTNGDRLIGTMSWAGMRKYSDARMQWDQFRYVLSNGTVITADLVEGKGNAANRDQPEEFTLAGHASFGGGDRGTLEGDSATYSDRTGLASVPGPARFTRGRMSGTGTGGSYERDTGAFKLLADTRITIAAGDAGAEPLEATSKAMTFVPDGKAMMFDEQARLVRGSDALSADKATVYLSGDEQRFRSIQLRGHSRVTPVAGQTSDLPDMQGDEIDLNFYDGKHELQNASLRGQATMVQATGDSKRSIAGGQVSFATAPDGKTLTRLEGTGGVTVTLPPSAGTAARTIKAATLIAAGNDKNGLTSAVFEGAVDFTEDSAESRRSGRAQKLSLELKGQLEAIDRGFFERDTHFTSGDNISADADQADYRVTKGELDLRPAPRNPQKMPHATNGEVTVDAKEIITVNLDSNAIHARTDVQTTSVPEKAPKASQAAGAIFDSRSPWTGSGAEFTYDPAVHAFQYSGGGTARAQLKQTAGGDESVVIGQTISFAEDSEDLQAQGTVETRFAMARGDDRAKPSAYRMTATKFSYSNAKRTATYEGSKAAPATLKGTEDETTAEVMILTLAPASRTLERLEAKGAEVRALQKSRLANGNWLLYDAVKDSYKWSGKPLEFWTRNADGLCRHDSGNYAEFDGLGAAHFPPPPLNPAGNSYEEKLPCPAVLNPALPPAAPAASPAR